MEMEIFRKFSSVLAEKNAHLFCTHTEPVSFTLEGKNFLIVICFAHIIASRTPRPQIPCQISRMFQGIFTVVLLIGIGSLPVALCIWCIWCIWCIYKHYPSSAEFSTEELSSESSPQPEFLELGLNESRFSARDHSPSHHKIDHDYSTTDFYPKIVLGESWTFPRPEDSTCSICIDDYQPNETLKFIPECYNSFHVEYIDVWLRKNVACPVCRNTPLPI